MERRLLYRYKGPFVPVQSVRQNSDALGLALYRYKQSVYRYKGVGGGLNQPIVSTVEDFVADVAPRAVRAHVLPGRCEEAGEGASSPFLSPHRSSSLLRIPASTIGVSARSPRRSVGSRRDLVHWIRDFERNPQSPHLQFLVKLGVGLATGLGDPRLIQQTRQRYAAYSLGSAHECHSGVRLVLLRWCRSCQLDLLSTDQLEWIEPDSRNGAGTGVFTVPGTEPQVSAAAPSADQDRGKGVASTAIASYTGKILLYTADLSACPGKV
uniref:Uncharacterized protein n=1 Tax=Ananas comosus var. bracteatus TaxID=296719 RepID=A0A6V7NQ62_ANACO|nr:unnamed protein product [Ananas comosus var. bracteatus]